MDTRQRQSGNTVIGFAAGLVAGLLIAVGVALYMTKAPVPFMNKVQRPTENVNPGADGKLPDPNTALYSKPIEPPKIDPTKSNAKTDPKAAPPPPEQGVPKADAPPPADSTRYVLQAGAFRTPDDADAMRARLVLLGLDARVSPVDQNGTTWYRVRVGPYGQLDDINRIRKDLADNGIDSQVVRLK
ncbi:MAG TPA: SPOR domain-containing protein [Burkholderiaceae bacterium]|nr:SPOR domain-containing protein [Burkholderiaceae bacterium]